MTGTLGIIAGAGDLPVDLAERCAAERRPCFVLRLKGLAAPALDAHPGVTLPLGRLGEAIRRLKAAGCDRLMFVGKVMRPRLRDLSLDWRGFTGLLSLLAGAWRHDDRLHRAISRLFERDGIAVVGPAEIWPDLLVEAGTLSARAPDERAWADIRLAAAAALEVGATDRGQGAVARDGAVVAVEDRDHTDGLLARVAALPGRGGVLAKFAKAHQDRRLDLPVIGPETIAAAAAARLDGVVIEAGGAMLVRRAETLAAAEAAGLFLVGLDPAGVAA